MCHSLPQRTGKVTLQWLSRSRDVLTSGGVAGEPWEVHETPSTPSLTIHKPPRPLLWRVHPQLGALEREEGFCLCRQSQSSRSARWGEVPKAEQGLCHRQWGPGCAQPCAGLWNEPCRACAGSLCSCLAAQAPRAGWILSPMFSSSVNTRLPEGLDGCPRAFKCSG